LIDKLELLLALAKERHFGRAAEACGVTQPTMSTSLKQLEEILGVMLVQRGSRFQGFTPEGERTLDWARRIVGDARAMRQEINGLKDKLSGDPDRGDPNGARDGSVANAAVSRPLSGRAFPNRVLHVGRRVGPVG
jgi:DNA-binding transcriptional LysR family regulator